MAATSVRPCASSLRSSLGVLGRPTRVGDVHQVLQFTDRRVQRTSPVFDDPCGAADCRAEEHVMAQSIRSVHGSHSQIALGPLRVTPVDLDQTERSMHVEQALALVRRAMADTAHTLDSLAAHMGKDRAYIARVLKGEKPMSLAFIVALPDDLEARYEQLRAQQFGLVVVAPCTNPDRAIEQLVTGLVSLLAPRSKAVA